MTPIPRAALFLGLFGLVPFFWGALTALVPALHGWGMNAAGPRFVWPDVSLTYGTVILAFMSGVLWGFAARTEGRTATAGYVLSVIPALWAFFLVSGDPVSATIYLAAGFVGLLGLDFLFWWQGLAPIWWMQLRLLLTTGVLICLCIPILA